MLEAGVPFSVVNEIMGWSAGTAVRMAVRYGHIGQTARRDAVNKLASATVFDAEGSQKLAQMARERGRPPSGRYRKERY